MTDLLGAHGRADPSSDVRATPRWSLRATPIPLVPACVPAPVSASVPAPELRDAAARRAKPTAGTPQWAVRYRTALLIVDVCGIAVATIIGTRLRFGPAVGTEAMAYTGFGLAITLGWLVALQSAGGYEVRHIATGPEEAKRVLRASGLTVSVLAITCYALKIDLARGFVVGTFPTGVALLLLGRTVIRRFVRARRDRGEWTQRILAVGTSESVQHLLTVTERARGAGLRIVGACVEDAALGSELASGVPVLGGVREAAEAAEAAQVDVVAVTGSGLGPTGVRELGWRLEGSGRGMVMAPALTEIAGPRVRVSPVEGLPLFWLEQPQLGRLPRILKRTVDIAGACVLLMLASPVLIVTALAVACTSRGPVLFRQRRLGVNGQEFTILKFRSMHADAESRRQLIVVGNEQDGGGVLFKMRRDPRVTPVGRWIRRLSIDELPQLINVIAGTMSLVGPRPLAASDSTYTGSARRRLLVRPGITGLWQVSGRSELSWEDAVRLDLYYVENWSLGLDLSILTRTILAVLARRGAY